MQRSDRKGLIIWEYLWLTECCFHLCQSPAVLAAMAAGARPLAAQSSDWLSHERWTWLMILQLRLVNCLQCRRHTWQMLGLHWSMTARNWSQHQWTEGCPFFSSFSSVRNMNASMAVDLLGFVDSYGRLQLHFRRNRQVIFKMMDWNSFFS